MKLQQTKGGQYFFNVPKSIAEAKGWKKGQELKLALGPKGELIVQMVSKPLKKPFN